MGDKFFELGMHLLFVFILVGIVCSVILEILASIFHLRAKALHKAIHNLLGDGKHLEARQFLTNHFVAGSTSSQVDYITARTFTVSLFELLAPATPTRGKTVGDLKSGAIHLPNHSVRTTILSLLDAANGDIDLARKNVEQWFDDSMAFVSSRYKRMVVVMLFIIALTMCSVLNCDLLMIPRILAGNDFLQGRILDETKRNEAKTPSDGLDREISLRQDLAMFHGAMELPIGWSDDEKSIRSFPGSFEFVLIKFFGIFASSILVTIAAVVWFDVLNTFINLRLSSDFPNRRRVKSAN